MRVEVEPRYCSLMPLYVERKEPVSVSGRFLHPEDFPEVGFVTVVYKLRSFANLENGRVVSYTSSYFREERTK